MKTVPMNDKKIPTTLSAFLWHFIRRYPLANSLILFFSFAWTLDQVAWPYMQAGGFLPDTMEQE
jgi:hypothetical protein